MAVIPDFYKEATVVIGIKNPNKKVVWIASGFLVGRYEGKDNKQIERFSVYLITNKHVVAGLNTIEIQYNYQNTTKSLSVNLFGQNGNKLFTEHPNPDVDVVAIRINVNVIKANGINLWFFSLKDNALNLQQMKSTGVTDGSFIYALGFPVGITQLLINNILKEPVCRFGCIAKIEHLYHPSNKEVAYLVDSNMFPGNSGGPVINRIESISLTGTKSNSSTYLIGIIGAYLPYQEHLYSHQTNRDRMTMEENSGLAIVYPVDNIIDAVEIERTRSSGLNPDQNLILD